MWMSITRQLWIKHVLDKNLIHVLPIRTCIFDLCNATPWIYNDICERLTPISKENKEVDKPISMHVYI